MVKSQWAKANNLFAKGKIFMLDGLRNFARTWPGKILGVLMLIGLAGFGMSGVFTSLNFNTIANVGKEEITTRDFQRNYSRQINEIANQIGSTPTAQEAIALGIPSAVLSNLASEAVLNSLGKDFGLGISDELLGERIQSDPSFSTITGGFDTQTFRTTLRSNGWSENEYFEMQTKVAIRQQLALGLFNVEASKSAVELMTRFGDDKRDVEYFVVSKDTMLPPSDPTQAEIAQYLSENQSLFRTIPLRQVDIMALSPQIIAQSINIGDEEIASEYERTKASYNRTETRTILQLVLDSDIILQLFETGKSSGVSFNDLVSQNNLQATNLGALSKSQILDSSLGETAFSLAEKDFEIISGFDGERVIYIEKINAGGLAPLSEVSERISQNLKLKQARELYLDYLDQIEEMRAAFIPINEIGGQYNLDLISTKISQSGDGLEQLTAVPVEGRERVANSIFRAKEDGLSPSIALGANLNVWFDLKNIEPARDQRVDEVGEDIKQALLDQSTQIELKKQVDALVSKMTNGSSFEEVAVSGQYALLSLNEISLLNSTQNSTLEGASIKAMFGGEVGYINSIQNSNGDYIVFHVLDVSKAEQENEAAREFMNNSIIDSIYSEFVTGLREDAGIRINQQTLTQIIDPQSNNQGLR